MENNNLKELKQTAELIRKECIKAAVEAYETASQNGVCREGTECAVDTMKSLKNEELLKPLIGEQR